MTNSAFYWRSQYERMVKVKDSWQALATQRVAVNGRDTTKELLEARIAMWRHAHYELARYLGMTNIQYQQYLLDKDLTEETL